MLKKLTLTIVLFLSILCLGGCNMEEEKDEEEEKVEVEEYNNDIMLYLTNHLNTEIELTYKNCAIYSNGGYKHKQKYPANYERGFGLYYNDYGAIDIIYNGNSYQYKFHP